MAKHNEKNNRDPEAADLHEHSEDKGTGAAPNEGTASRTQPQHLRSMEAPDAQAVVTGVCGETMGIYLRLNGNTIREATFLSDGCTPAVAYANLLTTMVQGMSLTEARRIKPQDLIVELRRLLDGHDHCAKLAVNTLHHALADGTTHDKASRKG
jgi:nitrogen fixation NifU-like protein